MKKEIYAFGLGVGTKNANGEWLEVYFPKPMLAPDSRNIDDLINDLGYKGGNKVFEVDTEMLDGFEKDELFSSISVSHTTVVAVILSKDAPLTSVPEAYLKLQLLSHRKVKPNEINLKKLFETLPNVAWTNQGAIDLEELRERQFAARIDGKAIEIYSVDKFPRMVDYVVPSGVRIGDASRVRLGAYLGKGTTVMHEGFVNFNAGTLGSSMIEGRISAGVVIDTGSDLGGGCSTMGTLSGGGSTIIKIGKNCLVGANAGVGICLGNNCIVEAGLYITAGAKVNYITSSKTKQVKARELSGKRGLLFRRNSLTGAIECLPTKSKVELTDKLHSNN